MTADDASRPDAWAPVEADLDLARAAGRPVRFWLRDDDAVTVTPALERLHGLCAGVGMPVLLAVIPAAAEDALGGWVAARPLVTPCQHGFSHTNRAVPGERVRELRGTRPLGMSLDELARGRSRLRGLFGERLADVLVPPWNRIDEDVVRALPSLGFHTLSTFGRPPEAGAIVWLNCDLDLIDWRAGHRGRAFADVANKLATLVAASRTTGRPIGILAHHLAHDEMAWAVLGEILERSRIHAGAAFTSAEHLFAPPTLIRLAVPADRSAVERIVREAYAVYVPRIGREPGPMLDDYESLIGSRHVHVLLVEGEVQGLVVLIPRPRAMLLDNIALATAARKRGYGRRLIAFAEQSARDAGYDTIVLYTHEAMTENQVLYTRLGFTETHRVEEHGLRRVYMAKSLRVST